MITSQRAISLAFNAPVEGRLTRDADVLTPEARQAHVLRSLATSQDTSMTRSSGSDAPLLSATLDLKAASLRRAHGCPQPRRHLLQAHRVLLAA